MVVSIEVEGLLEMNVKENDWSIDRQVRLISGLLVLTGIALSVSINIVWLLLSFFIALGMVVSSIMGTCAMGYVLERLPWNKEDSPSSP